MQGWWTISSPHSWAGDWVGCSGRPCPLPHPHPNPPPKGEGIFISVALGCILAAFFGSFGWGFFYNPTISAHFLPFGWGLALGMGVEMVGFSAISAHFSAISTHFLPFWAGLGVFVGGGMGGLAFGQCVAPYGGAPPLRPVRCPLRGRTTPSASALPPTGAHWPQG